MSVSADRSGPFSLQDCIAIEHAEPALWVRALPELIRSGTSDAAALPCAGGWALHFGGGTPLSYAIGVGVGQAVDAATFGAIERFYRERGVSPCFEVSPLADPAIYEFLGEGCYRPRLFFNLLAHDLSGNFGASSAAIAIREVLTPDEREVWHRTVVEGFASSEGETWIDTAIRHNAHAANHLFLAWIDGQPASGSALALIDGVAVLFGGSTRPAFRCRGVQSAMVQARLLRARQAGARLAAVKMQVASPSQRTMERAGFRVLYSRVRMTP